MADYRKMYYLLCSAASKAIDAPSPEEAKQLLRSALLEAEEMYLNACGEADREDKPHP